MSATNRNINYPRSEAKNGWRSIDADSQDAAASMSLLFLSVKAANIWWMEVCNQSEHELSNMRSYQSLMLRWPSFSERGGDSVAVSFAYERCQYIGHA